MAHSPETRKAIKEMVVEVSGSMTRTEGERSFQSEAIKKVAEEHGVDKKVLRRMARAYHNQNYDVEKANFDDFETAYEEVFNPGASI